MTKAADRIGRKWFLVLLSVLSAIAGVALALSHGVPLLAAMAFVGMLNGTGTDRSAAFAVDQAVVPGLLADIRRTWGLACYNVLLDGGGSLGGLAAGLLLMLQYRMSLTVLTSYRIVFLGYSVLCVMVAAAYLCLSSSVEVGSSQTGTSTRTRMTPESKKIIAKITKLFSLGLRRRLFDRCPACLLVLSALRNWGAGPGIVFFGKHILNACSHLGAAWLARHIGLVNTKVFTHLPSSLFLMAVPLAPSFKVALVLFLCREALVEMDVPTQQSYVAAVVLPNERTFASGMTNLARNLFGPLAQASQVS